MICQNCGTQNGSTAYCTGCGAPLATSVPTAPSVPAYDSTAYSTPSSHTASSTSVDPTVYGAPTRSKGPAKLIIICAAAGCLVIALLIFLLNLGNIQAKNIAKKTLNAYFDYDYAALANMVHGDIIEQTIDEVNKNEVDAKDRDDLDDFLEDEADGDKDRDEEYGSSYDYKILGVSAIKGKDLKALQDYYDDEYDLKVSEAKSVKLEVYNLYHGVKTRKYYTYLTIVKIGSKWYPDHESLDYNYSFDYMLEDFANGDDYDYYGY